MDNATRTCLEDVALMSCLCRVCKHESGRVKLLEFLTAAAVLSPSAVSKLAWGGDTIVNTMSVTKKEAEILLELSSVPHRGSFSNLIKRGGVSSFGNGGRSVQDLVEFVRDWRLPSNAHKFVQGTIGANLILFRLAVLQPYADMLPMPLISIEDILDAATEAPISFGS